MLGRVYWIDTPRAGRLAILARPRSGDWLADEIASWKQAGIDTVVSLLERQEVAELELNREAELCGAEKIEFISFPIPDRGVPASLHEAASLVQTVGAQLAEGKTVAVHCRAGIGRSALVAACALTRLGYEVSEAFALIAASRGLTVPDTDAQRDWVVSFGNAAG
jgi:protein-tyrosine phosphatase